MITSKLWNMTIKRKLMAVIMLTSVVALLLALTAFVIWEYFVTKEHIVASWSTYAAIIADNSKAAVAFKDETDAEQILSALRAENSAVFACLYSKQGQVLAKYQRKDITERIEPPKPQKDSYAFKNGYLAIFKHIKLEGENIGTIYLQTDLSEIYENLIRNLVTGLIITTGVLFAAYFSASQLQKIISKPILNLAEVAKNISEKKDYSTRAVKNSNDEVGLLTSAFNEMLEQIQQRDLALTSMNEQLEVKVKERTAELTGEVAVRKKAEQALQSLNKELETMVEKLTGANRELRDFAYIASHDLREPLRKISSFGALLKDSLGETLNPDDQENFDYMVNGADRMNEMIEGLLQYSRLNTKEISFETVDLNETVKQLEQLELAAILEEANATIEVPQPLPKVWANPIQMSQLLQNLIANGIKYRREEAPPRIVLKAKQADQDTVRIEVQDNGIGIKEEYHGDIFAMFRRLHPRKKYEGTGIGLAVCKKIVEKHGGQIGVESQDGQGATFWFTLPLADQTEQMIEQLQSVVEE